MFLYPAQGFEPLHSRRRHIYMETVLEPNWNTQSARCWKCAALHFASPWWTQCASVWPQRSEIISLYTVNKGLEHSTVILR